MTEDTLLLLHGTTEAAWVRIQESGAMTRPYLTCRDDVAAYYSECAVDEEPTYQGQANAGILLAVRVPTALLRADLPAFDEPLDLYRDDHADSEDEWHELIENEEIPYPEREDWLTSLQYTGCVASAGDVPLANIEVFDPQRHRMLLADPATIQPAKTTAGPRF